MRLVKSPVFTADDQVAAIDAILKKAKIRVLGTQLKINREFARSIIRAWLKDNRAATLRMRSKEGSCNARYNGSHSKLGIGRTISYAVAYCRQGVQRIQHLFLY